MTLHASLNLLTPMYGKVSLPGILWSFWKKPDIDHAVAISPGLFSLTGKKLLEKLPFNQLKAISSQYWMRFAGNNGRAPLERSEAELWAGTPIGIEFDVFGWSDQMLQTRFGYGAACRQKAGSSFLKVKTFGYWTMKKWNHLLESSLCLTII
ncbi:MAG: hypothetical protein IPN33_22725 [Saprospiraceae bacterium]|nr:hypothetical protein [Saprospiraceae bacterium]